jgi:hypothetical protein
MVLPSSGTFGVQHHVLASDSAVGHALGMSAQRTLGSDELSESDMLDSDTSAAILRWLETAEVPDGIDRAAWETWADGGCRGPIESRGVAVTRAMLANWARTGTLQ